LKGFRTTKKLERLHRPKKGQKERNIKRCVVTVRWGWDPLRAEWKRGDDTAEGTG